MDQVGIECPLRQLLEEPLTSSISIPPLLVAPRGHLVVNMLGNVLHLGRVWDDCINPPQGTLAELKEEWGLVGQLDPIQHVAE